MGYFVALTPMYVTAGHGANPETMECILSELRKMKESHIAVHAKCSEMARSVTALTQAVNRIESTFGQAPSFHRPSCNRDDGSWICPVCEVRYSHRSSFKGHIRKLVHPSSRPGCHLNPLDANHVTLVRRFEGQHFHQKARLFCQEFYHQVCACSSAHDTIQQSQDHIAAWLAAANTDVSLGNMVEFPIYDSGCRNVRKYRRTDRGECSETPSRSTSNSDGSLQPSQSSDSAYSTRKMH